MADQKVLTLPSPLSAGVMAAAAHAPPAKVLRVVAEADGPLDEACVNQESSGVSVTSRGLANIIHIIGGMG
jgi:hypothetical protein